jgi:hypothetical protein
MSWRERAVPAVASASSWRERAEPIQKEQPPRKAEAALQGLGQASTLGYLPNIQAAAQKVTDPLFSAITGSEVEPESYIEARDDATKRDAGLLKQHPGAYMAGQAAGTLLTPTPGLGLATKGASILKGGLATKAALQGAIGSALYNPGEVEGEISGLQLGDRAKQGFAGAVMGGGISKAGQALGSLAPKLKQASNFLTTSAMGAQKGDFKRLLRKEELDEVAEFARKTGIVKLGNNVDDVVARSKEILQDAGPKIKQIYTQTQAIVNNPKFLKNLKPADAKALLDSELMPKKIAKELGDELVKEWTGKAGGKQVLGRVLGELDQLKQLGKVTDVDELLKFRRSVDDLINYDKAMRDMPGAQEALVNVRRFIQNKIDNRINTLDKIVGGDSLKQLKVLNNTYKNASTIQKISEAAKAGDNAKMLFGITERQAALGGAGLGAMSAMADGQVDENDLMTPIAYGLLTGAGSKLGRRYGPGVGAPLLSGAGRLADGVGGLLQSPKTQDMVNRMRRGNE